MSQKTEHPSYKKQALTLWLIFLLAILFFVLFFKGVANGLLGVMPSFEQLENPTSYLATEIYSSDHKVLGKYYKENRSNIRFEDLPNNIKNALIATEDVRFEKHSGIDLRALIRAITKLGKDGGGSTLTQQLAKNLFTIKEAELKKLKGTEFEYKPTFLEKKMHPRIRQKLKEWVIAVQLEHRYTKEEIFTTYLNTVEFSDNAFGIKSAAKTYFNKLPIDLETHESAVLVGMLQAPYKFNPRINNEASKGRRNIVLYQMHAYNFIDKATKDSLQAKELKIDFQRSAHTEGLAPYFREELKKELKRWVLENPKSDGSHWDIYGDGLKIYTTLNSQMQVHAEEAVEEHLSEMQDIFFNSWKNRNPWKEFEEEKWKKHAKVWTSLQNNVRKSFESRGMTSEEAEKHINTKRKMTVWSWHGNIDTTMTPLDSVMYYRMFLQTGFLAVNQKTGAIKAWVGGANFNHFQYDHVNVNTKRQVGSTFKPLIYTLAVQDLAYSPCLRIPNEPVTFEPENPAWPIPKTWTAKNSGGLYGSKHPLSDSDGQITIRNGLKGSVNSVAAFIMFHLRANAVLDFGKKVGIESDIPPVPSVCLGTPDISLSEIVGAYTMFSNDGNSTKPFFISKIEDNSGSILFEHKIDRTQSISKETAYVMTEMLQNVVDEYGGTGHRLRFKYKIPYSLEIAGKTGTTQNNSDGWFIGFTPDLLAGTWVGCEDRFIHFRRTKYGQGASTALPIFAKFINKVYSDTSLAYNKNSKFPKAPKDLRVAFNCEEINNNDEEEPNDNYQDDDPEKYFE